MFSILFGFLEPFESYKHDKSYDITYGDCRPVLDGILDEECWSDVDIINSFTQLDPDYNATPTEKTEIKIIQDDYAIYIGARLLDSNSSLIAQKFVNRDDFAKLSMSDWFSFSIDSHHDHQTGYEFIVNAAGVQFDSFLFDDTDEEINWDGTWESMVSIDQNGWTAEIRIPFSSLRFSNNDSGNNSWGINIKRYIHRKNEYIEWVVLPKGTIAGSSKFGHLNNIKNTENESTVEVIPYISMGQMKYDDIFLVDDLKEDIDEGYKSYDTTYYYPKIGLDVKVHLSNNTIFDFTTLPDFGQIESDPADINFTYYDTYFNEKRNFFIENITLFDSPIDLFHSRRIGENPNYEINQYENLKEALVLGAAKVTGKTKSDITYGFLAAKTMSQKRNDLAKNIFTLSIDKPVHNYAVGRLSKDIFSGNSYFGITGTMFQNERKKSTVISHDGLYYLLDNQLFLDSQVIYSLNQESIIDFDTRNILNPDSTITTITDTSYKFLPLKRGAGVFLEFEYSIPNIMQIGSSLEYYDAKLDINDVGYLIRNDLFQLTNKIVYYNDKCATDFKVRDFSIGLNHIYAKNNDNILLANIFNSILSINFSNYSFLDISHTYALESNEDRLYAFTQDTLFINQIGKIPSSNTLQVDFGNDPNDKFYFDISLSKSKTDIGEEGTKYMLALGANISEDSDFFMSLLKISGNENYRFLDQLQSEDSENLNRNHFIFSNAKNINKKFTFRYNKFFQNGINIQIYHEYFAESHQYSTYSELVPNMDDPSYPSSETEFITSGNFYCLPGDINEECSIDPNYYIYHYPNYNEMNLNLILSWEFSKRSNIYFIYKIRKSILGQEITNYLDLVDYIDFINYKHSDSHLSEIWNDQAIYVKVDYWFDF